MGLAAYFSRASIAAAHVLAGFDDAAFRRRLARCTIAVAFDAAAAGSHEGITLFDLSLDLLARLYPTLTLVPLDQDAATTRLLQRARTNTRNINGRIDRDGRLKKSDFCLIIGSTPVAFDGPHVYAGSDGWRAKLDSKAPVGSGTTANPFGAAAAACVASANVFRAIFGDQMSGGDLDVHVDLNVLDLSHDGKQATTPLAEAVDIGEAHLAGVGAIGHAAVWTLSRVPGLQGKLHLVDHQKLEFTNFQRYSGTKERECGLLKTKVAAAMLTQPNLTVVEHPMRWGAYLAKRGTCDIDRVAVALDTARDRMAVQACLPRRMLNAWTQPGDLGVSRHGFIEGPCAVCLYMPTASAPSESALVAQAVRLPEPEVRVLLFAGTKVDRLLAERIAVAAGVDYNDLRPFIGEPLRSFYVKAVCGTTIFGAPEEGERGAFAVPMAFQSALAGVLLAVEIVADALSLRQQGFPPTSRINLLRPLGRLLNEPAAKSSTGRCICQDPFYVRCYRKKYCSDPDTE